MWSEFIQQDVTVWKDFHEFWLNAKIPVHIVRYEDIVTAPEPTLKSLLEFILNVEDLAGTKVHQYLKIAVGEQSPQIYKPRVGKVNGNFDKFNRVQLDFINEYTYKYLRLFNYYSEYEKAGVSPVEDIILQEVENQHPDADDFIVNFNEKSLK
jgi:hypothetical protein